MTPIHVAALVFITVAVTALFAYGCNLWCRAEEKESEETWLIHTLQSGAYVSWDVGIRD